MEHQAATCLLNNGLHGDFTKLYLYLQPTGQSGCDLADVISAKWTQKRRRSSGTRTRRWRKEAEVLLPCEHYLVKMNDHTYCVLHNQKGEASVSGRRRRVRDRRRHKRRINIGVALPKWKSVKVANGFRNTTDVAFFLLDRWVCPPLPMNVWRKRWFFFFKLVCACAHAMRVLRN